LWLQIAEANKNQEKGQIIVETSQNIASDIVLPNFEDQMIKSEQKMKNASIPKVHVMLEIYDELSIKYF
jgi:hypothetical protein